MGWMFSLDGKYALVTGSSRGIGSGIAKALAEQGANVAVNCATKKDKCEWVAGEIRGMGRDSIAMQADVSKKTQVVAMFKTIEEKWGRLDILINNAGIIDFSGFEEITERAWDKVLDVNLKGQFLCAQQAVKLMEKNNWGRIINIASISSGGVGIGFKNISHYTASKGGVIALTENMALELAEKGINVNAIAPGAIETDMAAALTKDKKLLKATLTQIPKGRIGKPEDIGAAAVFLASEEADYVTGTVIYVDGGWLAIPNNYSLYHSHNNTYQANIK
jgi:NAD(P)-dependent dehydrogenase (short-subunit alcohol dehydrogenase family)